MLYFNISVKFVMLFSCDSTTEEWRDSRNLKSSHNTTHIKPLNFLNFIIKTFSLAFMWNMIWLQHQPKYYAWESLFYFMSAFSYIQFTIRWDPDKGSPSFEIKCKQMFKYQISMSHNDLIEKIFKMAIQMRSNFIE